MRTYNNGKPHPAGNRYQLIIQRDYSLVYLATVWSTWQHIRTTYRTEQPQVKYMSNETISPLISWHNTPMLKELHWLPIEARIKFKVLALTYKALHGLSPKYLKRMLSSYEPSRNLRSSDRNLLSVPKFKTATYSKRCFRSVAPTLWNQLPDSIRKAPTLSSFKNNLKTHLFKEYFHC